MTRTELIERLATEAALDKAQAKKTLEALATIVEQAMREGGEVPFAGLGKFKVSKRAAREGRNPQTGETIQIPAKTAVKFSVAKSLKDLVK